MIAETLKFVNDELNARYNTNDPFATMTNVAHPEALPANGNVNITLVNIEEEKTLKNGTHYVVEDDSLKKRNPTIFLNLYVLFSCNHSIHEEALKNITKVIQFFQRKSVFTQENSPNSSFPSEVLVNKIVLDLFTLNFEQINHLWGIMGGKYTPSVLYKLRIVAVQNADMIDVAEVKEIQADANAK
jgi:Pvc16 N-terminal domain